MKLIFLGFVCYISLNAMETEIKISLHRNMNMPAIHSHLIDIPETEQDKQTRLAREELIYNQRKCFEKTSTCCIFACGLMPAVAICCLFKTFQ